MLLRLAVRRRGHRPPTTSPRSSSTPPPSASTGSRWPTRPAWRRPGRVGAVLDVIGTDVGLHLHDTRGTALAQRVDRPRSRRRPLRHRPRRARRFAVRARRRRQPRHRGPRPRRSPTPASTPASTSTPCSPPARVLADARRPRPPQPRRRRPRRRLTAHVTTAAGGAAATRRGADRCWSGRPTTRGRRRRRPVARPARNLDRLRRRCTAWSVADLDGFWAAVTEFTGVRWPTADGRPRAAIDDARRALVPRRPAQLRRARARRRQPTGPTTSP